MDAQILWDEILKEIKEKISGPNFETWFSTVIARNIEGNTLILLVDDPIQQEWLEARYTSTVLEAASKVKASIKHVAFIYREASPYIN
ncbi:MULTISPECIES: DnaA N-terminal domain-containing protein [Fictibacillus]|uniref:DnaA N-terminal domain-containing protein n=1 Tax=Fictibacillus terranigra TaxID=3058424 RepID=A0ABT8EAT3_9BACL|nr:DnaA N-terminal domain-containing protein [Fictibacillus sp. CENA-BCM004]MDN4074974.1 DnaA N-terminal domain-containing protein [Fictibacillus sp. CENA-BCM004]